MPKIDFHAEAQAMRDELVARRRDFHMHPEIAFEEVRTSGIVAKALNELGLEVQTGVGKTGVIGILEGASEGPTVLVRADMDALPMQETNKTDYISTVPNKMHACGHDGHTAIGLGVAKLFAKHKDKIAGRIKFVFQPAEEIGQGARAMANDGALENPRPDVSLGLHLWNDMPLGQIGLAEGPIMAAASVFEIRLKGKGGHGAQPEKSIDPVICASQITMALQTIVSRNTNPMDTAVVSVTQIQTGSAYNIIPDSAVMRGTFRTFSRATRDTVERRLREIAQNIAAAMLCEIEVEIHHHTEPVINNENVTERARKVFMNLGVKASDFIEERTMGAEDVSVFMTETPGLFFFVGSANAEKDLHYAHHHPRFDFDEAVLPQAVALLAAAVGDYLIKEG